ncbi:hypothetical protein BGP_2928 [Beggiatoa sp. PS]|nr:hypothetical protein BGP_2928 [Beggiatoa sp. PS]
MSSIYFEIKLSVEQKNSSIIQGLKFILESKALALEISPVNFENDLTIPN